MRVFWTLRAIERLRGIERYIAREAPRAAPEVVRRIVMRSSQIDSLPNSGRQVPEFRREDVREVMVRPYRIIYRVLPDQVDVLTVRHYRDLLPEDLKKL